MGRSSAANIFVKIEMHLERSGPFDEDLEAGRCIKDNLSPGCVGDSNLEIFETVGSGWNSIGSFFVISVSLCTVDGRPGLSECEREAYASSFITCSR